MHSHSRTHGPNIDEHVVAAVFILHTATIRQSNFWCIPKIIGIKDTGQDTMRSSGVRMRTECGWTAG